MRKENPKRWRRVHQAHFGLTVFLVLALAGLIWYAYPIIRDRQQQSATTQALREEAARMGRDLRDRISAAGAQAHDSAEEMFHRFRGNVNEKIESLTVRVAAAESSRESDLKRIASLQQELGQVRQQVANQGTDIAAVRGQVQDQASIAQERLGVIENKVDSEKVPFEALTGKSRDLGEGMSLIVSDTDTSYRRVNGRLWLSPDKRNIWLRDLSAQEPLVFYGYRDGKKRELVITNVSENGVSGYLLVPKPADAGGE